MLSSRDEDDSLLLSIVYRKGRGGSAAMEAMYYLVKSGETFGTLYKDVVCLWKSR